MRSYLERHATEIRPNDLTLATFVVAQAVVSLTHEAVAEKPETPEDGRLVDEVSKLMLGYLASAQLLGLVRLPPTLSSGHDYSSASLRLCR